MFIPINFSCKAFGWGCKKKLKGDFGAYSFLLLHNDLEKGNKSVMYKALKPFTNHTLNGKNQFLYCTKLFGLITSVFNLRRISWICAVKISTTFLFFLFFYYYNSPKSAVRVIQPGKLSSTDILFDEREI